MAIDASTGYFVLPCSIKAVVLDGAGRALLGLNPRNEWELLGGRPDPSDRTPAQTLAREIREEAGVEATVGPILDSWIYNVEGEGSVLIVTYQCSVPAGSMLSTSHEHQSLQFFPIEALKDLPLQEGYRSSILRASGLIGVD